MNLGVTLNPGVAPRLFITTHAAIRYQERWAPHLSYEVARRTLFELSASAKPTRERMRDGKERWLTDADETIALVVARDRREFALPTCVTVLPAYEAPEVHESVLRMQHLEAMAAEAVESGVHLVAAPSSAPAPEPEFDGWCVCRASFARFFARKTREPLCASCYRDRVEKVVSEGLKVRDVLGRVPTIEQYLEGLKARQSGQVAA